MQEPLKILTITIGILHFMQEPLKILTITIGILHFVQEPLKNPYNYNRDSALRARTPKKILTITIGILHFMQEPLINNNALTFLLCFIFRQNYSTYFMK